MIIQLNGAESVEVEFEAHTVGPLVLTTPVFRNTGFGEIIDRICPLGEQAELSNGQVAELVAQCRLSDPRALYDVVGWAQTYAIDALYGIHAQRLNDDRLGRMLDDLYPHRARIWGEWVATIARRYQVDFSRLHADTMAILLSREYAHQPPEGPKVEPGYNPREIWTQQLKLFALVSGDGSLPVWFDLLNGGASDSTTYVPQFEAFCQHAALASQLPLDQILLIGDSKMPSEKNQLAWLRMGVGYIAHLGMEESHRRALGKLLEEGHSWREIRYVSLHDAYKKPEERPVYRLLGHEVALKDPEAERSYPLRHLYVYSSALAYHQRARRQAEVEAIEKELKRIQGLVNKYDYKSPEIIVRRVEAKAFRKRPSQNYFQVRVVKHPDRPEAPLELVYHLNQEKMAQDPQFDGVYLLVAHRAGQELDDEAIFREWKEQHRIEHRFAMLQGPFMLGPVFLKTPKRIASLVFLIMAAAMVASLIERQVRRVVAQRQKPIQGLMPERRDNLKPTVERLLKVFATYSLVVAKRPDGKIWGVEFATLDAVQRQIWGALSLPEPAQIFALPGP